MVKHIVFFKLTDNSDKNKELVKKKLLSLQGEVEVLQNIEVGLNFADEDRAYDIALLTDFNDEEDLKTYAVHPYHLEVVAYIKKVALSSKVVDFKY
ncbi:MAG TPA: Dabb family protein [Campylobacterales bacterium]|nr:Dabb family protein [Campylobacterales bacterium]HIP60000.1 Dabb family protein [Campylobacterales bacterium]